MTFLRVFIVIAVSVGSILYFASPSIIKAHKAIKKTEAEGPCLVTFVDLEGDYRKCPLMKVDNASAPYANCSGRIYRVTTNASFFGDCKW